MTRHTLDLSPALTPACISPTQWQACLEAHWLSPFDVAMAQWLQRHVPNAPEVVVWLTALLARQSGQGHVRLELADLKANPDRYGLNLPAAAAAQRCIAAYDSEALARLLSQSPAIAAAVNSPQPLVLDAGALYWQRAWREECAVALCLNQRLTLRLATDTEAVEQLIARLFEAEASSDDQRAACRMAAQRALTVITGGPGTGKTTTVVRVLAILQSLAEQAGAPALRIALAAPTGKAAARLSDSIASQVQQLPLSVALTQHIPTQVSTVHRLLGVMSQNASQRYRHHASNPLALDVLVVDEASMLDLSLMAALLEALPAQARLILLGDKDQLASVEAGAVLADVCAMSPGANVDQERPRAAQYPAHVAALKHSFRFDAQRGIGKLAYAVRTGMALAAPTTQDYAPEVRRVDTINALFAGYAAYWASVVANEPAEVILKQFDGYRLLCAVREGPQGVSQINQACERYLRNGSGDAPYGAAYGATSPWYVGRPVMITRNDYGLRLMNGDIGICLRAPGSDALRVAFWDATAQRVRWLLPSRLPSCDSVFAMTVHKSQGSEFSHVALILPASPSPVVTRELIYTALTRARHSVDLCIPSEAIWRMGIETQAQRYSGLSQRLRG